MWCLKLYKKFLNLGKEFRKLVQRKFSLVTLWLGALNFFELQIL